MNLFYSSFWGTILLSTTVSSVATRQNLWDCKCLPLMACWPSETEWQQLNSSVAGSLISHIRPVAAPCYKGTTEYDEQRCEEITEMYTDSFWRADQAGDVQHPTWETYAPTNESCYLPSLVTISPNSTQCKQGNIPHYAVRARDPKDISAAVKFAAKYKIPTVIKNSGHDYLGRASRRNALMIWTHFMNETSFLNADGEWFPSGCKAGEYRENDLLVKVSAGVNLHDLYRAVSEKGRLVVAGAATTVGVTGGYIQGGGHSPLSPYKGMGSDHAVEFEVVTADGSIVKASPCENPDLFWALRGGGGSTFGVVTSVTLRTHPDANTPLFSFNATIIPSIGNASDANDANTTLWELVTRWHTLAPAVKDLGGSGYYYIVTNYLGTQVNAFIGILFFVGQNDVKKVEDLFAPLMTWAYENIGGPETGLVNSTTLPPVPASGFLPSFGGSATGSSSILGSRLLSRDLLSTPEGVNRTTAALAELSAFGGVLMGHYVTPPNNVTVDSAVHPAWRKAISHLIVSQGWEAGDSFAKQEAVKKLLTQQMVPKLKALDWDEKTHKQTMGAYLNEADKEEENWQDSFWGENYDRLSQIKKKWDPNGVFWCRPCVGSEEWDSEGICRK